MIQVISFDIGGTLVDTSKESHLKEALYHYLKQNGIESKDAINRLKLNDLSIEEFCDYVGIGHIDEVRIIIEQYNKKHTLYCDVLTTISYLGKRYKLVTISNSISLNKNRLSNYDIEKYFDLELYSFQYNSLKPDKKMFLYVENYFNVNAKQCLHIGDSMNDICGANRSGWISVLLDRKNAYKNKVIQGNSQPDYIINNLYFIEHIIQKVSV